MVVAILEKGFFQPVSEVKEKKFFGSEQGVDFHWDWKKASLRTLCLFPSLSLPILSSLPFLSLLPLFPTLFPPCGEKKERKKEKKKKKKRKKKILMERNEKAEKQKAKETTRLGNQPSPRLSFTQRNSMRQEHSPPTSSFGREERWLSWKIKTRRLDTVQWRKAKRKMNFSLFFPQRTRLSVRKVFSSGRKIF